MVLSVAMYGQSITAGGPTTICGTGTVLLTVNGAAAGATFQWQNNGVDITGATGVNYTAASTGSYGVVITTSAGTNTISPVAVTISPYPTVPSFTFATNGQCANVPVNFNVASPEAGVTYTWTFGDGGTSFNQHPNHSYLNTSLFTTTVIARLVVTNSVGCTDSVKKLITVYPEALTVFTMVPSSGCSPKA